METMEPPLDPPLYVRSQLGIDTGFFARGGKLYEITASIVANFFGWKSGTERHTHTRTTPILSGHTPDRMNFALQCNFVS
jgi:hypothetical protein